MGLEVEGEKRCFESGLLGSDVYLALHTADPDDTNEVTGGGYARVPVSSSGWSIDGTTGRASNTAVVAFPVASGAWTAPTHITLWDAATGGNRLVDGALTNTVSAPQTGVIVEFAAGSLRLDIATD